MCLVYGKNYYLAEPAFACAVGTCTSRQIRVDTDSYFLQRTILETRRSECRSRETGICSREFALNLRGTELQLLRRLIQIFRNRNRVARLANSSEIISHAQVAARAVRCPLMLDQGF